MKTNLSSKNSMIFGQSSVTEEKFVNDELEVKQIRHETVNDIEDLIIRLNKAIDEKDEKSIPWLQLEVQARSLILLNMIDWKLWEVYNKFV
jgi:hypothetical protein